MLRAFVPRPSGSVVFRVVLLLFVVLASLLTVRPVMGSAPRDEPLVTILSPCVGQRLNGDQELTVRVRVNTGAKTPAAGRTLSLQLVNQDTIATIALPLVRSGSAGTEEYTADLNTARQHLALGRYQLVANLKAGATEQGVTTVNFAIGVPLELVQSMLQRLPPVPPGSPSRDASTIVTWANLFPILDTLMMQYVDPVSGLPYATTSFANYTNILERVLGKSSWRGDDAPFAQRVAEVAKVIAELTWRSVPAGRQFQLYRIATAPFPDARQSPCNMNLAMELAARGPALFGAAQNAPAETYAQEIAGKVVPDVQINAGLSLGRTGDQLTAASTQMMVEVSRGFRLIQLPQPGAPSSPRFPVDKAVLHVTGGASASAQVNVPVNERRNPPQRAIMAIWQVPAEIQQVGGSDWNRSGRGVFALAPTRNPMYDGGGPPNVPNTVAVPAAALLMPPAKTPTGAVATPRFAPAVLVRVANDEPPPDWPPSAGEMPICYFGRSVNVDMALLYHQAFPALDASIGPDLHIGSVRVEYSLAETLRDKLLTRLHEVNDTLGRQQPIHDQARKALDRADAAYKTAVAALDASRHEIGDATTTLEKIQLQIRYIDVIKSIDAAGPSSNQALKEQLIAQRAQLIAELKQRGMPVPNTSTTHLAAEEARLIALERAAKATLDRLYNPYWDAFGAREKAASALSSARGAIDRLAALIQPLLEERDRLEEATAHARLDGATLLTGISIVPQGSTPNQNVLYRSTWWDPAEGLKLVNTSIMTLTSVLAQREKDVSAYWQDYVAARADEKVKAEALPRAVLLSLMAQAGIEELDFVAKVIQESASKGFVVGAGKAVVNKLIDLAFEQKLPDYTIADEEKIRKTLALEAEKHANIGELAKDAHTLIGIEKQVAKRYLRDQTTKAIVTHLFTETSAGYKLLKAVATHSSNANTFSDFFKGTAFTTIEGLGKKAFGDALKDGIKKWGKSYLKHAISDAIEGDAWREMFLAEFYRIGAHGLWVTAHDDVIGLREELAREEALRDQIVALYNQNDANYYRGEESCPLNSNGHYTVALTFSGSTGTDEKVFIGPRQIYQGSLPEDNGTHLYRFDPMNLAGIVELRVQVTNLH